MLRGRGLFKNLGDFLSWFLKDNANRLKTADEFNTGNFDLIKKLEGRADVFDENGEKLE